MTVELDLTLPEATQVQLLATSATSPAFTAKDSVKGVGQKGRNKLPLTWRASKPIIGLRLEPDDGTGEYRFYGMKIYPLAFPTDTEKTA